MKGSYKNRAAVFKLVDNGENVLVASEAEDEDGELCERGAAQDERLDRAPPALVPARAALLASPARGGRRYRHRHWSGRGRGGRGSGGGSRGRRACQHHGEEEGDAGQAQRRGELERVERGQAAQRRGEQRTEADPDPPLEEPEPSADAADAARSRIHDQRGGVPEDDEVRSRHAKALERHDSIDEMCPVLARESCSGHLAERAWQAKLNAGNVTESRRFKTCSIKRSTASTTQ